MVRDAAYHFPPKCVKLSEPTAEAAQEIQLFKLRIALVKLLDADKYQVRLILHVLCCMFDIVNSCFMFECVV